MKSKAVPVTFHVVVERAKAGSYVVGLRGDVSEDISNSLTASAAYAIILSSRHPTTGIVTLSPNNFTLPNLGASTGEITANYVYSRALHP